MERLKKYLVITILIAIPVCYILWDMRQAADLAADACDRAVTGRSLDDYFADLSQKDYRIMLKDKECILVAKGGLGCCRCVVFHDGRAITGSKIEKGLPGEGSIR